jgi:hypothetical protein
MRKFVGLFAAAALLVPAAIMVSQPAGAAGGTSCAKGSGSATFTPPLPDATSTKKVKDVLKSSGTIGGCKGGGVTGGTLKGVSPASKGSNCKTLLTPTKTPTKVTLTVTWNTKKTSTIAATLSEIPKVPVTTQKVAGTVTKGLFAGSKISGKITYTAPKNACTKGHPLAKVTYKNAGATVIK